MKPTEEISHVGNSNHVVGNNFRRPILQIPSLESESVEYEYQSKLNDGSLPHSHSVPHSFPQSKSEKPLTSPTKYGGVTVSKVDKPKFAPQTTMLPRVSSRIDPSQIPRPSDPSRKDSKLYHKESLYYTRSSSTRKNPPSVNSLFLSVDNGNALPQHIRSSLVAPPSNREVARKIELPFTLIATPFAPLQSGEEAIPVVDDRAAVHGPPRCRKCQGYINVSCDFLESGHSWKCNLCLQVNVVPDWSVLLVFLSFFM
jgi:protein transport protein SEC24